MLLGFQDPDLGRYRADAPTVSRASKYLAAFTAVQQSWSLFTLDAQTAFLSGDQSERPEPLYFRPPPDLRAELKMQPWQALLLEKAAYGLSEAPRAWWRRLHRELVAAGFQSLEHDPLCTRSPYRHGRPLWVRPGTWTTCCAQVVGRSFMDA